MPPSYLILFSLFISTSQGFEFPKCSDTCMHFFPNLSNSFAHGYDPNKKVKIEKPKIVTNERKKRHSADEEKPDPDDVDLSDHPVNAHEDVVCYGHACMQKWDDYDKFITPYEETVYGKDTQLPVHFAMTVFAVETLHGSIWMDFMIEMTWEDNRINICLCDDYDNIRDAVFPRDILEHIFVPDIVFLDAMQDDRPGGDSGSMGIWMTEFTGGTRVLFKRRMSMTLSCFLNFRWFPDDVNACPVLLTAGLDHVYRVNLIMTALPHARHLTRGEEFFFNLEELPDYIGTQSFTPYTKYGVSKVQHFTGFQVVMRRKISEVRLYNHYLSYFVHIIAMLVLVPLRHQKLTPLGLLGLAISAVYTHLFAGGMVDWRLKLNFRAFPSLYIFALIQTGLTMCLQSRFESRYISVFFDGVCFAGMLLYWNTMTGVFFSTESFPNICPDLHKTREGNYCIHNIQTSMGGPVAV